MSFVDEVKGMSSECNCSYKPFSQSDFFKDDSRYTFGMCFGIALSWIEAKFKGSDFFEFNAIDKDLIISRQALQYPGQLNEGNFLLSRCCDGNGDVKCKDFTICSNGDEINDLLAWVTPLFKNRYFLVSSGRHQMAIINTFFGRCVFFDPNCGEVSGSVSNMRNFLFRFFRSEKVKSAYWNEGPFRLTLTKYK